MILLPQLSLSPLIITNAAPVNSTEFSVNPIPQLAEHKSYSYFMLLQAGSVVACEFIIPNAQAEDVKRVLPLLHPQMWVEALRQIFQWPHYINTAAVIIFLCSMILFAVLMVTNQRLVSRLKVCCCVYSKEAKCHTTRKFKWPMMIPILLVLVSAHSI